MRLNFIYAMHICRLTENCKQRIFVNQGLELDCSMQIAHSRSFDQPLLRPLASPPQSHPYYIFHPTPFQSYPYNIFHPTLSVISLPHFPPNPHLLRSRPHPPLAADLIPRPHASPPPASPITSTPLHPTRCLSCRLSKWTPLHPTSLLSCRLSKVSPLHPTRCLSSESALLHATPDTSRQSNSHHS